MSEKKNLDRLFQEKLKDFEQNPPEFVWENIREVLEEKKKRRAVPLWFRYSGVAAGLVAGAFFGWQYLSDGSIVVQPVPGSGVVVTSPNNVPERNGVEPLKVAAPEAVEGIKTNRNTLSGSGSGSSLVRTDDEAADGLVEGSLATERRHTKDKSKTIHHNRFSHSSKNKHNSSYDGLAASDAKDAGVETGLNEKHNESGFTVRKVKLAKRIKKNIHSLNHSAQGLAANSNLGLRKVKQKSYYRPSESAIAQESAKHNTTGTGTTPFTTQEANVAYGIGTDKKTGDKAGVNQQSTVIDTQVPVAPLQKQEEQAVAQVAVDTVKPVVENELEKLLREKEAGKKEEDKLADAGNKQKWNIKPQVAPVLYNSFSKGSPIDSQFAANSKSYDKNLSYGVGVDYAVNSRLSIRTGVNTVNLNYATQDIYFYASLDQGTSNVSGRSSRNANIVVSNNSGAVVVPSSLSPYALKGSYNGAMVQTTGYVEVPMEMSYALLRNKFGIQVIGGLSTLFLNENKVSVVSTEGLSTTVGEAQNLNNVHFSTNIGIGFKYRIFKALEANFEPTFKYQVNTYSRDAGNFKPYFIGLYSGVSFSF